jgi:DNA-binding SARP family transcriptional activator
MEFLILGPLEVWKEQRRLPLPGAGARALLGLLLIRRNQIVANDRLIEDLWGDTPPQTAAAALQMRVSALRKTLEGHGARSGPSQILITRPPGYLLRVAAAELDADRFEARLRDGREAFATGQPEAAAAALEEALQLWRGEPLADLADEPFAQAEIARLSELRLAAIEERIEADLALGRHRDCSIELDGLVALHPLRERLRGQLMVALYRSGRQAEALAVYHETRRVLQQELGIEPGPALQRLEMAVLNQDASLEPPILPHEPDHPEHPTARRKTVTVVVGEPAIHGGPAPTDPEALRRLGDRHLTIARDIVERHGGTIESWPGEAFLAVFGVPAVHEDDALRAIRAADEVRSAIDRASSDLLPTAARVVERIGIATGKVITGDPDTGPRLVVGEPVQSAGRLARAAADGDILLSDATRVLAQAWVAVEPANRDERLPDGWRLLGLEARARESLRPESPLVGRTSELDHLTAALDRAVREQRAVLCTILGPAGIGKSRLAHEFVATIQGRARVLTGRCVPYGEGITFWPLNEMIRQAAPDGDLAALLEGDERADVVAQRIAGAIGSAGTEAAVEETFWAARRLFEALARAAPLVVVIEDVHWAEPTLLGLIEYLADWISEAPVLLLCVARPELLELRPGWGAGRAERPIIGLGALAEDESAVLLDAQPGASRLSPATHQMVRDTAEGNPFFIEQIAAMAADLVHAGDFAVPMTIEALLTTRLDRLGPGERAVIDRASVMGREVWPAAIVGLLPAAERAPLPRYLDALVRKDLLRPSRSNLPGEEAFKFRHALIQQSAYRSLPTALRAQLHEQFGVWLEDRTTQRPAEFDELIGYHFEQAFEAGTEAGTIGPGDTDVASRAVTLLAAAGRRAFARGDMPASVNLLERASALLVVDDPMRLDLLSDLGFALFEVGELERSSSVLAEVVDRGTRMREHRAVARANVKLMHVGLYTHPEDVDADRDLRKARDAMSVMRHAADHAGLARAWILVSDLRWIKGSAAGEEKACARAARHAHLSGSRRDEAWSLGGYGFGILFGPRPVQSGVRDLKRRLREAAGDPVLDANLSGFLAPLEAMDGRIDEARARLTASQQVTDELGLRWQTGTQDLLGAVIEQVAGDPVAAEKYLMHAAETFQSTGDMWFLGIVTLELARAIYEQGRDVDAMATLQRFDALPPESGVSHQLRRSDVLGRILARSGEHKAGLIHAQEAVRLAERTDFIGFAADAHVGLAHVLRLAAGEVDGLAALERAVELYERKGNRVMATRVRALRAGKPLRADPQMWPL